MVTTQTVRAVLANNQFITVELHEAQANSADTIVWMAFQPTDRGNLPQLQLLTLNVPAGQSGATSLQALQQAWPKVQGVAQHHNQTIDGLECNGFALLDKNGVLAVAGSLPITKF
ncbi:hypothetical protein [Cupriavidus necator]